MKNEQKRGEVLLWQDTNKELKKLPKTIFWGMLHPNSFRNMKEHFEIQTFHHPTLSNLKFKFKT
jgi:hypothetical protein